MKRIRKILLLIVFITILNFVFISNVSASSVKINGGSLDIYESGGEGTAIFDKTTNTLTLNGYNDDYILFEDFDEKTVNVVLKGNNTIKSSGYVYDTYISAIGFDYNNATDNVTMNVTGEKDSKLNISGYYNGIYIPYGTLNVSNINLETTDVDYTIIYVQYGDLLSIKDSEIKSNKTQYPIANDDKDIIMDNVKYTAVDTSQYDIGSYNGSIIITNSNIETTNSNKIIKAEEDAKISNSKIVANNSGNDIIETYSSVTIDNTNIIIDKGSGIDTGELTIKNSNMDFKNIYNAIYGSDTTIDNCSMDFKNVEMGFSGDSIIINNSNIDLINDEIDGTVDIFDSDFFMSADEVEFNNSNINAKTNGITMMVYVTLKINNSDVNLLSNGAFVLYSAGAEKTAFDERIILNDVIDKEKLFSTVVEIERFGYIYSYFTEEPAEHYTTEELENIISIATKKLTFVAKNSVSFDANGGTGSMKKIFVSGETNIPKNGFVAPEGKTFKGWSLTKDGEIIEKLNVNGNIKLYAIWDGEEETTTSVNNKVKEDNKKLEDNSKMEENPKTGDNIGLYLIIGSISLISLVVGGISLKRKKFN